MRSLKGKSNSASMALTLQRGDAAGVGAGLSAGLSISAAESLAVSGKVVVVITVDCEKKQIKVRILGEGAVLVNRQALS